VGLDVNFFLQEQRQESWQVADTITYRQGERHVLMFGVDVRRVTSSGALGSRVAVDSPPGLYSVRSAVTQADVFLEESVRISNTLRLNAGVRFNGLGDLPSGAANSKSRITMRVDPRMSLAWSAGRDGRFVIRVGAGIFTGQVPLVVNWRAQIDSGNVTAIPPFLAASTLPGNPLLSDSYKPPSAYHYSVTVDWNASRTLLISLGYVGTEGRHLARRVGVGSDNPYQTRFESDATSSFQSLQFELRKHYSRGLAFGTSFTWAHSLDTASDFFDTAGAYALPQDNANGSAILERASSNFDIRLRSVTHALWDISPRRTGFWGGWQLTAIGVAQTGQPFTVNLEIDRNADGFLTDRPDNLNGWIRVNSGPTLFAPGVGVSVPEADGRNGAMGRNAIAGFNFFSLDTALSKRIPIGRYGAWTLRLEAFNPFNRPNYGIPIRILAAQQLDTFGTRVLSPDIFGRADHSVTNSRTLQVALKYEF
jgi:hypothetical protein